MGCNCRKMGRNSGPGIGGRWNSSWTLGTPTEPAVPEYQARAEAMTMRHDGVAHCRGNIHVGVAGVVLENFAEVPRQKYAYDPHRPPVLRFDATGVADRLPELLETARQRALSADEAQILADALRSHEPWLEWASKHERRWFEVDPVALHIHERVSAQAIMRIAARQNVQRSLWADPELEYHEAVQFYQWAII